MSAPGAGFEYPPNEVSWQKRDVLLFATSIGATAEELHFLYEFDPTFQVFPTYPVILPFKLTDTEIVDFYARTAPVPIPGVPKLDPKRIVDGQRHLFFYKPLPPTSAGRKFELRSKVVGVYDKGKSGTVVETEQTLVEVGTGDVYSKAVGSIFYFGQGGWGGPKGPASVNYPPPSGKKPDAVHILQTTAEAAHLYRLNGDYNPLHVHPEMGMKMGFGGPIMHGLYTFNVAAHGLLKVIGGGDSGNIKEFQARFAAPVKPGDKLVTEIWRLGANGEAGQGWEEVRFITRVEGGKVVLSNGRAVVKVAVGEGKGQAESKL